MKELKSLKIEIEDTIKYLEISDSKLSEESLQLIEKLVVQLNGCNGLERFKDNIK
jgi:hypothetical protein